MKLIYSEKLLTRHVRFLNSDLIEIYRPTMQIWRLVIIIIGLGLAFISWIKHANSIYTRDDTFMTYVSWFIQPSTEKHNSYLQYAEEQATERQAIQTQLEKLAKGSKLPANFIEFRERHLNLDYFSAREQWDNYLALQQKLADNSVKSEQEYYQSDEHYTFDVKREVALGLIGFPLLTLFVTLLLPNPYPIRIDRRRRMIYLKETSSDQFYIHQLPEWTKYDDIEQANLPLFLLPQGLYFILPDSGMKQLNRFQIGRLGLIRAKELQTFIQDFISGKYVHFTNTTPSKSLNIIDCLLGTAFYSYQYTPAIIEKGIDHYQQNWGNLSFEERKAQAEKMSQDMQEKSQSRMSELKIMLSIIMVIYAIFRLLRAF
ncbi:hypothetical protein BKK56_04975 [Rodentibacter genomosp. 2]|uniref:hypothetical protein n=1 Tax=Rodentibacter genomosp. 2 TaxID=1908266 RepID=UPI000987C448|nr:hypothetical protein BKK56_04975 [Rodentibacter genomosp. 2]